MSEKNKTDKQLSKDSDLDDLQVVLELDDLLSQQDYSPRVVKEQQKGMAQNEERPDEKCISNDVVSRAIKETLDIKDGTRTKLPQF